MTYHRLFDPRQYLINSMVAVVVASSILACVGWLLDSLTFTGTSTTYIPTAIPTALLLLASAFTLSAMKGQKPGSTLLMDLWATPYLIFGLYILGSYFVEKQYGGYFLFEKWGRISPATALSFILFSGVVYFNGRYQWRAYVTLATLGLTIAFLVLVGYLYDYEALYRFIPYYPMSLMTALGFLFVFSTALLIRTRYGWLKYILSEDAGGHAARRLIPVVVALTLLITWGVLQAYRSGVYEASLGFALVEVLATFVFVFVICRVAAWLSNNEQVLREARAALDMSEDRLRHVRVALNESEGRLQQAQKMEAIGNLTGGMAHDFNNLLGVVIGNLDLLQENLSHERDKLFCSNALEAALRGAELTRRLLAFARRQSLQPRVIEVNQLIENIVNLLRRTLGENIQVVLELLDVDQVMADPAQLEAAIMNLATNARDAMPNGGVLHVATGNRYLDDDYAFEHTGVNPGRYVMIEVSDTGTGISPHLINRIFDPFFTTKQRDKGTGLGLSMVYGFMKQSNGHINVSSEMGVGTTFRLYLPKAEGEDMSKSGQDREDAWTALGGQEKVLLVEDNTAMRQVTVQLLNGLGYQVIEAADARSALDLIKNDSPDVLISDIVMPGGMNGYELAKTAAALYPNLKVVLTSGFPDVRVNGEQMSEYNHPLLSKPYRRVDLDRAIRSALGRRP